MLRLARTTALRPLSMLSPPRSPGQRRLQLRILPPQRPGEMSAAEIQRRVQQRLEQMQRDGAGSSALDRCLAGLKRGSPSRASRPRLDEDAAAILSRIFYYV